MPQSWDGWKPVTIDLVIEKLKCVTIQIIFGWLDAFGIRSGRKDRGLKCQNFPVGRLKRAKTFRTERVNHFCDKCIKKTRKSFSRHIHQYVFETIMYQKWLICFTLPKKDTVECLYGLFALYSVKRKEVTNSSIRWQGTEMQNVRKL